MSHRPVKTGLDRTTTLCLACSSSLPPLKAGVEHSIFLTNCCNRPICPSCIASNPRLARYDPCLACLGGVGAIFAGSSKGKGPLLGPSKNVNVDGAVRDEDTFVLDDDEDDDESGDEAEGQGPPPAYTSTLPEDDPAPASDPAPSIHGSADGASLKSTGISSSDPYKYYIRPNDNLQGIALRFSVAGRELCRLNNLPPSALSTTPHILHTRAFITLPPSARFPGDAQNVSSAAQAKDRERERRLARERAEKRVQTLTKEVDWRVAKAYVALADAHDTDADSVIEENKEGEEVGEKKRSAGKRALESRAVDRYMDDEEWEERERREGRHAVIAPFPYFGNGSTATAGSSSSSSKPFWRWKA